jgi:hypothetical protein
VPKKRSPIGIVHRKQVSLYLLKLKSVCLALLYGEGKCLRIDVCYRARSQFRNSITFFLTKP